MSDQIRRRGRGWLWAATMAASAGALLAGTLSAQAAPPPAATKQAVASGAQALFEGPPPAGFASWQQVVAMQNKLNRVATAITEAARKEGGDRLGSITADPRERTVRVYWKGTMPVSVSGLIGTLRRQAAVQVRPARYGEQELLREERRLAGTPEGARMTQVAPLADAGGLRVTMRAGTGRGAQPAAAAPRSRIRLVVEYGAASRPAIADRYHDTSPFWGGGAFSITGHGTCTTGFAVNHAGKAKLLTAGHCGVNGNQAITGGLGQSNGLQVGTIRNRNVFQDVALIDPPANSSAAGQIYNGFFLTPSDPYTSNRAMPVGGSSATFLHNLVYTSGALSGFRPTITVMAVNVLVNEGTVANPRFVSPLVQADKESGENAVGNGDSGGPVGWFSDDFSHFIAMGTISAGGNDADTGTACTGVPEIPGPDGRTCSWRVYYAATTDSLSLYGATIRTA